MESVGKPKVRFQRANYVVSDMERALTFYRDILGFELAFMKDSPDDSYSYEVFQIPRHAKMRFAVLNAPGQPRVMALTELKGVELAAMPRPSRSAIVLDVEDFDGIKQKVFEAGLTIFDEGKLLTNDGRTGRELGFLDPDGNLVVIYTILTHPS